LTKGPLPLGRAIACSKGPLPLGRQLPVPRCRAMVGMVACWRLDPATTALIDEAVRRSPAALNTGLEGCRQRQLHRDLRVRAALALVILFGVTFGSHSEGRVTLQLWMLSGLLAEWLFAATAHRARASCTVTGSLRTVVVPLRSMVWERCLGGKDEGDFDGNPLSFALLPQALSLRLGQRIAADLLRHAGQTAALASTSWQKTARGSARIAQQVWRCWWLLWGCRVLACAVLGGGVETCWYALLCGALWPVASATLRLWDWQERIEAMRGTAASILMRGNSTVSSDRQLEEGWQCKPAPDPGLGPCKGRAFTW